ncbi:MAG: HAD-IA family hydrolase [Deltaproteobacteria bacterium]|jgi:HAD superfamily hydrolase (TIGR01509 family)|nr:HAD-IA family hydrolase [Deltaproteobacteria bacterium]MBW2669247.1 HAD-IA family hydrolase [Deltaproteobacteria bacterium]
MPEIKAIFFDQDGVIIDTEKDGHRVAFNEMFREFGYDFQWDVEKYHELLQISGGKERMRHYFREEGIFPGLSEEEETELLLKLHKRKTEIFIKLIESGKLPLRTGVKRLMHEALDKGLILGVCTTANERSANAIARGMLHDIKFNFVLAGDVVGKKKPDPEIYLLALEKTGLTPETCIVIEDSRNGVLAADKAGMHIVATTNIYTENEDLSEADIVVTSLGDPDGEKGILKQGDEKFQFDGVLKVEQLLKYFSA